MMRARCQRPFEHDTVTVKVIMKVYRDFRHTMMHSNNRGAFQALGLDVETRMDPFLLLFDEKKLRDIAGFRNCGSLLSARTGCRAADVLLGSVRSTNRSKTT
jgi:hypothetical protein